jgi:hypothetical protein
MVHIQISNNECESRCSNLERALSETQTRLSQTRRDLKDLGTNTSKHDSI